MLEALKRWSFRSYIKYLCSHWKIKNNLYYFFWIMKKKYFLSMSFASLILLVIIDYLDNAVERNFLFFWRTQESCGQNYRYRVLTWKLLIVHTRDIKYLCPSFSSKNIIWQYFIIAFISWNMINILQHGLY